MAYALHALGVIVLVPFLLWIGGLWLLALYSLLPRRWPPATKTVPFFAIIVPAHNEAEIIADTVRNLLAFDYPPDRFSLTVVADNCTDDTAAIAVAAGARVLRRKNAVNRGKSHALAFALERLRGEPCDAVLFMDADSQAAPDYLQVMARYVARGDRVIQGRYEVNEPDRNWFTRLTSVSFVLRNRWLFPACDALGITIPLRGSGMCFAAETILSLGWESHGLIEDTEMSLRLIRDDIPVSFASGAISRQFMPATPERARTQRLRWSAGEQSVRGTILRDELPAALRRGDWRGAVSLILIAAPPFSLQMCAASVLLVPAYSAEGNLLLASWLVVAAYGGYFLLGLGRLDRLGIAAIAMLPVFALWRVGVYFSAMIKKPAEWIRTPRK